MWVSEHLRFRSRKDGVDIGWMLVPMRPEEASVCSEFIVVRKYWKKK
jgi:hypothetical protein